MVWSELTNESPGPCPSAQWMQQPNNMNLKQGFTLIEIIAVLVILGILASVTLPRVFDFRADARAGAADGALAAGAATLSQAFGEWLLDNPDLGTGSGELRRLNDQNLGEFVANLILQCGLEKSYVEITGGPTWWPEARDGFAARLYNDRTSFQKSSASGFGTVKRTYTICD